MFVDEDVINERLNSNENLLFEIDSLLKDEDSPSSKEESHKDVSDEESMKLLDQALNPEEYNQRRRGRGKEKTYEERADIGVLATITSTNQAAEMLGISTGQAAVHRNGKTNFYDDHQSPTLKKRLRTKLDEIAEASADKLLSVLNIVDEESIENMRGSALKATQVGQNLARIIEKVQPKDDGNDRPNVTFVMMQPPMAKEEDYEIINVT